MPRLLLGVCAWMMVGCAACFEYRVIDDDDDQQPPLDICAHVEPDVLDFLQVSAGQSLSLPVTISSTCEDTLYLEDLFIEGPMSLSLDDATTSRILASGTQTILPVTYAPETVEDVEGKLHILNNDRSASDVTVALFATSLAPSIELEPQAWDFVELPAGDTGAKTVQLHSTGSSPLHIHGVVFEATSGEMSCTVDLPDGLSLAPGESESVIVEYQPYDDYPDTGYLYVYSDDPDQPTIRAVFYGNGAR